MLLEGHQFDMQDVCENDRFSMNEFWYAKGLLTDATNLQEGLSIEIYMVFAWNWTFIEIGVLYAHDME